MVCADDFAFIHLPKTGGSFVQHHLLEVFPDAIHDPANRHGTRAELPRKHRRPQVVGCLRNPFDWYVSHYEFHWWRRYPQDFPGIISHRHWPQLGFADFVRLAGAPGAVFAANARGRREPRGIGAMTVAMVTWFGADPERFFTAKATLDGFQEQLAGVHFLHTDRLSNDLAEFLLARGVAEEKVEQIRGAAPLRPPNPTPHDRRHRDWRRYYTPALLLHVRCLDRWIFDTFPEFDA